MSDHVHDRVLDLRQVFGLKAVVTTSAASTEGASVEMECTADPGAATMIHFHPHQSETYEVLDGILEVFRDGGWKQLKSGESLTIPPGTIHGFRNKTADPTRFRNTHRPALGFQDHLEMLDELVRSGKEKARRISAR